MTEGNDQEKDKVPETGTDNVGTGDQLDEAGTSGESTNPADGTPDIAGGGVAGQTQAAPPEGDVGVPEEVEERTE